MVQAAQESSVYDPEPIVESSTAIPIDQNKIQKDNEALVAQLHGTMTDGRNDLLTLRKKLAVTYWVIIVLSVIMFLAGIVLLSVPAMAAFGMPVQATESMIAAGFGIADLVALFLLKPIDRIHNLMGDMGQLTLAINTFRTHVGLRLLEMDMKDRRTIGKAAEHIDHAALGSIKLIQTYFETRGRS